MKFKLIHTRCSSYATSIRCSKFVISNLYLSITLVATACQKPTPPQPLPLENIPVIDTLTVTGYFRPKECRIFFDLRRTPTGELIHDDTVEPQYCEEGTALLKVETFRFPNPTGNDFHGLRFTLNQYLLLADYYFISEGFQVSSSQLLNVPTSQNPIYTFASPGKQHLQVFFPDSLPTTPVRQHQYQYTFQLVRRANAPCPTLQAPCPSPKFTLLEGTYSPTTDLVNFDPDLVNFQNLPDLHADSFSLSMNVDSASSSVDADSVSSSGNADNASSSVRIRTIYHLLTEDFALWSDNGDCQALQNWDLSLIPATGYNLLEVKLDPPFLECLRAGEGPIHFRIALLR